MKRTTLAVIVLSTSALLLGACAKEEAPVETTEVVEEPAPPAIDTNAPATLAEGFATPESVLYDAEQDVYFVSNINGQPLDADDNGYISKISAGDRTVSMFIDGSSETVELNAPKGMAIVGTELWVADINQIRKFDKTTGQPIESVMIEGATFLNDIAVATDGAIYVSDTGMVSSEAGLTPSGTDQVYMIATDGAISKLATDPALNGPNGIVFENGNVWTVSFRGNELYRIVDGKKADVTMLPAGSLDGVIQTGKGTILVSSWDGKAVYEGTPGGTFTPIIENVSSPADLGFDSKRNLVLVPSFTDNRIEIRPLAPQMAEETISTATEPAAASTTGTTVPPAL